MPPSAIHIDHLELDLRGVPPAVAQEAIASLGPALREALAGRVSGHALRESTRIARVATAPIRVSANVNAGALRSALAGQLASAIATQLTPPSPPA